MSWRPTEKFTLMMVIPSKVEKALRAAFATNNLSRICSAIDSAVHQVGVERFAENAELNRVTLYRAFRLKNGPALETMVRVLRVVDLVLTVEARALQPSSLARSSKTARALTAALRRNDLDRVTMVFAEVMSLQENVSEFARQTILSREHLYRAFKLPKRPRFGTLLSILNALGLQFSVKRRSPKSKL